MAARTPICTNAVGRANVVPVSLDEHLFYCANWGILRTTPTQTPRGGGTNSYHKPTPIASRCHAIPHSVTPMSDMAGERITPSSQELPGEKDIENSDDDAGEAHADARDIPPLLGDRSHVRAEDEQDADRHPDRNERRL
jgi:hypothetical protein